ncbi:hypothetical protein B0H16DRAFT_1479238 [Mycena metata]|uniref:Uncharacterized protein n=1 Tax=Mycena metata TaxID=1033252 RepID=A0AAD7MEE5_9AGAR|nr:hypothetical protein B0H16DRAFT_1479238 [Mycena metata]
MSMVLQHNFSLHYFFQCTRILLQNSENQLRFQAQLLSIQRFVFRLAARLIRNFVIAGVARHWRLQNNQRKCSAWSAQTQGIKGKMSEIVHKQLKSIQRDGAKFPTVEIFCADNGHFNNYTKSLPDCGGAEGCARTPLGFPMLSHPTKTEAKGQSRGKLKVQTRYESRAIPGTQYLFFAEPEIM